MGFLENFEKGLERVVTGAFSKTFKSELQPIEIASAIRAEMDSKASIVSRDRILAPNTFVVRLSAADFARMDECNANAEAAGTLDAPDTPRCPVLARYIAASAQSIKAGALRPS